MPSGNIIQTHYQLHKLGITTQFCYQLGLVLNTLWRYHTALLISCMGLVVNTLATPQSYYQLDLVIYNPWNYHVLVTSKI